MDVGLVFGGLDAPSETLVIFKKDRRPVLNACNFAGALGYFGLLRAKEALDEQSSLVGCGLKTHDFAPNGVWKTENE